MRPPRDLSRFVRANLRGRAAIKPAPKAARAVSKLVAALGVDAAGGPAFAEIAARWPEIVGDKVAKMCAPLRLTGRGRGGTLHVAVRGAGAVFVEAESARILERLNLFCGGSVARRLAITRAPARAASGPVRRAGLTPSETLALDAGLADVEHPRLKAALKRLGRGALLERE